MSNFITDDYCEDVVICDPNEIVQDCLPEGEDLVCLYTIDLSVPWKDYYWFSPWHNADQIDDVGFWKYNYQNVEFKLDKSVKTGENGIQQEIWVGRFDGGLYDDYISGKGLLEWIRDSSANGTAIAQVSPSVYLGDLIHFDLSGGAGDDKIQGANNADILNGDSGNDTIKGEGGDDKISGGSGDDDIYGGKGNDIIDGDSGNDFVEGGDGNDEINGGGGNDILYGNLGNDNLTGGLGNDQLWGGLGDDWSAGGDGNDTIISDSGDDCADGGDGDDHMNMGAGNDLAVGGAGNDYMDGGSGNDKLEGGDGDDYVYGGSGNDLVSGGDGDDIVKGGDGDDIVRGGIGEDVLYGGAGCDVFVFCEVSFNCQDVIEDFSAGRDPDQIDLSSLDVDIIRVEQTGFNTMVRLDLLAGGQAVQQILVDGEHEGLSPDLQSVFDKDTTYGTDDGALVKIGAGMMVDLPSMSIIVADDGGMFF